MNTIIKNIAAVASIPVNDQRNTNGLMARDNKAIIFIALLNFNLLIKK